MKEDTIPERSKLVQLTDFRIDRNVGNVCKCGNKARRILNTDNRQVYCEGCGALIDPFDALLDFANKMKKSNQDVVRLYKQAVQLRDYKPWLKTIRKLEKSYRGKKMLPNCPRCQVPFYLEELTSWTSTPIAERRIQQWKN